MSPENPDNLPLSTEHFPVKEKLHTDILEKKYGPIHADVIRHDNVREALQGVERIREARLVDEQDILRTYALTFLTYDRNDEELLRVDEEIREGGLIGKTFRGNGYEIKKNVIDVFLISIPEWMRIDFHTDGEKAKARLTEFYAKKGDKSPVVYGQVLEIYSPDFKKPEDGINEVDLVQVNPLTDTLRGSGIPADEIWARLDRASEDNEWDDVKSKYELAQKLSRPIVAGLHEKIDRYFNKK
jgi:hypothetical protein